MKKPQTKKANKKTGLPPGSVVFTGNQKVEKVFIHSLQYNSESLAVNTLDNHKEITFVKDVDGMVDWYDVRGLHDTKLITSIGNMFKLHPLIQEDIVDTQQRPKFEEYGSNVFIIVRALSFNKTQLKVRTEQVGIYIKAGLLLSFQETESDLFESVRKRILDGLPRIRQKGTDYLAYALIDNIVDHYYIVMEEIEEVIEHIEDQLLASPDHTVKEQIHQLKKELLIVRKSISPLREAINRFSKSELPLVEEGTTIFIRDLYDHTIQIMDVVENYRDILNGLQDLHISEISFRMNQVMQVLTIITTIFVPLSFLAGLYGMNFEYIPELHFKYGYFVLLGVMVLILITSLIYFKKKKWF